MFITNLRGRVNKILMKKVTGRWPLLEPDVGKAPLTGLDRLLGGRERTVDGRYLDRM